MPANLTKYCLSELTDYADFETLCHDLMALEGYPTIEPLGGFKDKGRDAVHIDAANNVTIFAYSVREDWRAKLAEDSAKIKKHGHQCEKLVFLTTAEFTAGERDEAIETINKEYGWTLKLFGLEWLRLQLDTKYPHIKRQHPAIFPPEFIQIQNQQILNKDKQYLFFSYSSADRIFAEWLARKLTVEGYSVWCESLKSLNGNPYPNEVNKAIRTEAFRFIAIYSTNSLKDVEVMSQRALAFSIGEERNIEFLVPLQVDFFDVSQLDRTTRNLDFIPFHENWATGLRCLFETLFSANCPKPLINGKGLATEYFFERDVLTEQSETLYSNCFAVKKIPDVIYRFKIDKNFPDEESQNFLWAYRKVNDEFVLSFCHPPKEIVDRYKITEIGGDCWQDITTISWKEGREERRIFTGNLVSELIRKSLIVKCHEKGMLFSPETMLHYFPHSLLERNRLGFFLPDGTKNLPLAVVGERKYYIPNKSEYYRYHLAPTFFVKKELFSEFVVLFRTKIHLTDLANNALEGRKRNSRRKDLCKDWFNDDWFKRMLMIAQFLSDGNSIVIGHLPKEQIILDTFPIPFAASGGIDENKLDKKSYERDEILLNWHEDDEES